jgi:hypothetical protein
LELTVVELLRLFEFPKMTSRPGDDGTARQVGMGTHFGLGPKRNEGIPSVVTFCMLGLTCGTVVKLIGQSWLERMMLSRMDSLRAFARLRLTVS